ncbi:hypothetical protein ACIQT7_05825 [Agrobacterium deltaense]
MSGFSFGFFPSLGLASGESAPLIKRHVILLNGDPGQSNLKGSDAAGYSATDDAFDVTRVRLIESGAAEATAPAAGNPMIFGLGNTNTSRNFPAVQVIQHLLAIMDPNYKIILLNAAHPSTGLVAGSGNQWWSPPDNRCHNDAKARLATALNLYPGSMVVNLVLQGENDTGIANNNALWKAAAALNWDDLRSVSGAEEMIVIVMRMLMTATSTSGKRQIDLAHRQMPMLYPRTIFAGGPEDMYDLDGGTHLTAEGLRQRGRKAASLLRYVLPLYNAPPSAPTDFQIVGENYSFKIPATHAAGFDVEVQDADLGGAWQAYEVLPAEGQMPGDTITRRVPGIRNVNVRVRAKSRGASGVQYSDYTPTRQCVSGGWWHRQVLAAIDYTNNRAYVNGTAYATIAAAVSAGALVASASGHGAAVTVPAAFTLLSSGVTRSAALGSGSTETLAFVDDGTANNMARSNYWWNIGGTPYIGGHVVAAGAVIGGNTNLMDTGANAASSTAVKNAVRVQAGNFGACVNGGSVKTVSAGAMPAGLATIRAGINFNGVASWTGTKGLIELTSVVFSDDELLRETAA